MRRLPVYLLIDTSGSMRGEPIESVKVGLEAMVSSLRQDPFALESVNISIITYDRDVKQILPLTMGHKTKRAKRDELKSGERLSVSVG